MAEIVGYSWSLDGDVISTSPTVSFNLPDDSTDYSLSLTVYGSDGDSDTSTITLSTFFERDASYSWEVDGVEVSTAQAVEFLFEEEGTYLLELTASDDDGSSTVQYPIQAMIDRKPADTIYQWYVDGEEAGTESTLQYTFTEAGQHTVGLYIEDYEGNSSFIQSLGIVKVTDPTVTFTWNWGDGLANSVGQDTSHTYNYGGTYTITLTITDIYGYVDSATATVDIDLYNLDFSGYFIMPSSDRECIILGKASKDSDSLVAVVKLNDPDAGFIDSVPGEVA